MTTDSNQRKRAALLTEIAKDRVLFIVGAGVSMGASSSAMSWGGLLKSGLSECVDHGGQSEGWKTAQEAMLKVGGTGDWIRVAEAITESLGGPKDGRFIEWMERTVGSWQADKPEVLTLLDAFGCRIATTNYDSLLTEVTGRRAVAWDQGFQIGRWLSDDKPGILHLHGHWERPESVILGAHSYARITATQRAQAVQQALAMQYSFVFVGCGGTTDDPNLGDLLKWMTTHLRASGRKHYRLCLEKDLPTLLTEHPPESKLFPLVYGTDHEDLAGWLRGLLDEQRATAPAAPVAARMPTPPPAVAASPPPAPPNRAALARALSMLSASLFGELLLIVPEEAERHIPSRGTPAEKATALTTWLRGQAPDMTQRVIEKIREQAPALLP